MAYIIGREKETQKQKSLPRKTIVHPVLVTTEGLVYNEYSGIFQNVVTIDELF